MEILRTARGDKGESYFMYFAHGYPEEKLTELYLGRVRVSLPIMGKGLRTDLSLFIARSGGSERLAVSLGFDDYSPGKSSTGTDLWLPSASKTWSMVAGSRSEEVWPIKRD